MPWNITKEFWSLYDKPADQRPLYPFHAEPVDEFVKTYAGKRDVPIFDSKFVVPVIYINDAAGVAERRQLVSSIPVERHVRRLRFSSITAQRTSLPTRTRKRRGHS